MTDKFEDFWTERGGLTVNVGDPKGGTVPIFVWKRLPKEFDLAVRLERGGKWESGDAKPITSIAVYSHRDEELDALVKALRFTADAIEDLRRKKARKTRKS